MSSSMAARDSLRWLAGVVTRREDPAVGDGVVGAREGVIDREAGTGEEGAESGVAGELVERGRGRERDGGFKRNLTRAGGVGGGTEEEHADLHGTMVRAREQLFERSR